MSEIQSEKKQEIIEKQENEQQVEQVKQVVAEVIKSEFSGPIPPPSIIKGYEEIVPGAAERIIAMAEEIKKDPDNIIQNLKDALKKK